MEGHLGQLVIPVGDGEVEGRQAVVLLALVGLSGVCDSLGHLDQVLDRVGEVPDEGPGDLRVDQTGGGQTGGGQTEGGRLVEGRLGVVLLQETSSHYSI